MDDIGEIEDMDGEVEESWMKWWIWTGVRAADMDGCGDMESF